MKKVLRFVLACILIFSTSFAFAACDAGTEPPAEEEMANGRVLEVLQKVAEDADVYFGSTVPASVKIKTASVLIANAAPASDSFTKKFVDGNYFSGTKNDAVHPVDPENPDSNITLDNVMYGLVVGMSHAVMGLSDFKQKTVYHDPINMFQGLGAEYSQTAYVKVDSKNDTILLDCAVVVRKASSLNFVQHLKAFVYPDGDDYVINCVMTGDMNPMLHASGVPSDINAYPYFAASARTINGVITEKLSAGFTVSTSTLSAAAHIDNLTASDMLDYGDSLNWSLWGYSTTGGQDKGVVKGRFGNNFDITDNLADAKTFAKTLVVDCGVNYNAYNSFKNAWQSTTTSASNKVRDWYAVFRNS